MGKKRLRMTRVCVAVFNDGEWLLGQLRHWLTITLFALFYGVLKWVYRNRVEPNPQETADLAV
jgi:cbb3-type cytochrome oxidase subunit 3